MSCIQLSPEHIAAVAHGLAFMLNGSCGMIHLFTPSELHKALNGCQYTPNDFLFDDRKIFPVLYELNEAAYNGRYEIEPDELSGAPAMPENFPRLLHSLDWDNGHYIIDDEFYKFAKLLDSFIYQCEEDSTRNRDLVKALISTSRSLYAFIVQQSSEYHHAEWII